MPIRSAVPVVMVGFLYNWAEPLTLIRRRGGSLIRVSVRGSAFFDWKNGSPKALEKERQSAIAAPRPGTNHAAILQRVVGAFHQQAESHRISKHRHLVPHSCRFKDGHRVPQRSDQFGISIAELF